MSATSVSRAATVERRGVRISATALTVAFIVAAGVILRLYGVFSLPFEQDELYTIDEATNLFRTRLLPGIQARPLYFLLEHPLLKVLPQTEPGLRALAFVFGVVGIWVTWKLARRVLDSRAAITATTLVALSPWHLYASAFGRYYSLLFLLAGLVYLWLPRAYDSDEPRDYLVVLLALVLGASTHPSFVFPVAGAGAAVMLVARDGSVGWRWPSRNGWRYLWLPFAGFVVAALVALQLVHRTTAVRNGAGRGLAASLRLIPAIVEWVTPTVFTAAVIGAVLLTLMRAPGARRLGFMALFGVAASLASLFLLSFFTDVYADYATAALPLVFVAAAGLVAWVVEELPRARRALAATAIAILLLVGMLPSTVSYLLDGTRFDYRPAFATAIQLAPERAAFVWPEILQRRYAPALRAYPLLRPVPVLDSILSRERRMWAIVSVKRYGIAADDSGILTRWLAARCSTVAQYQRPRLDYRLYRVDLMQCVSDSTSMSSVRAEETPK